MNKSYLLKIIVITTLMLSVFTGSFFSYASEQFVAYGTMDTSASIEYEYKGNKYFDTFYKTGNENEIELPYDEEGDTTGAYKIIYTFPEISNNGTFTDIELQEITMDFYITDLWLLPGSQFGFTLSYSYIPGRRNKLTINGLESGYIIYYKDQNLTEAERIDFEDIDITEKISQPDPTSYKYEIEFIMNVPKDTTIFGLDIYTSKILTTQKLSTTTAPSINLLLGKADIYSFNEEEANANNEKFAEKEANRVKDELENIEDGLKVPTPNPDELLEQIDPYEIIGVDDFPYFLLTITFIKDNILFVGMLTITFMFVLFKYVLFGKG